MRNRDYLACRRLACATLLSFSALTWSGAASATLVETSEITNYYSYQTNYAGNSAYIEGQFGAGNFEFGASSRAASGGVSAINLSISSSLDSHGNFSFLHNAMCVGSCYLLLETELKFTLTNTGDQDEHVRFDSLITPGHLARQNYGGPSTGGEATFVFALTDDTYQGNLTTASFSAEGEANSHNSKYGTGNPAYKTSDGSAFNGSNSQIDGEADFSDPGSTGSPSNFNVLDWGATNVGVDLPVVHAFSTRTLTYSLTTFISNFDECFDTAQCTGFQISFGDPRDIGGVSNSTSRLSLDSFFSDASLLNASAHPGPAVGAQYDPYLVHYGFVAADAPAPQNPPQSAPIAYEGTFAPSVAGVPEPSTWAMLLSGFGLVGASMRRRSRAVAASV